VNTYQRRKAACHTREVERKRTMADVDAAMERGLPQRNTRQRRRRAFDVAGLTAASTPHGMALLPREWHATFLVDVVRAPALRRDRHGATAVLLEAESVAADEVRCRPLASGLVSELLAAGPGAAPLPLRELAARCRTGATA
jgi:hypothetical protein